MGCVRSCVIYGNESWLTEVEHEGNEKIGSDGYAMTVLLIMPPPP